MSDPRTDRERRQAEALKANLRRRKAQSRAQDAAARRPEPDEGQAERPGEDPAETADPRG